MRVFVTGATGFIGSAIVDELIKSGHHVIGLARSEASAKVLSALGVEVIHGSLENTASLQEGVSKSDGVIHTAFNHDFSKFAENGAVEAKAVETLGEALKGSGRPLLVSSGVAFVSPGRLSSEDDSLSAAVDHLPRKSEQTALKYLKEGVKVFVVRLPPTVHGRGDHGFVPQLIAIAKQKGYAAYVDEGQNVWPAVHRYDAARLYVKVLENASAGYGPIIHSIAEQGVPFISIATTISQKLSIPLKRLTQEEAKEYFGWFAMFAGINSPSSSVLTQKNYNWTPIEPTLLTDIENNYFD